MPCFRWLLLLFCSSQLKSICIYNTAYTVSRQLFWICRRKKVQNFLLLSKRKHAIIPVGNLKVDSP